MRREKDPPSRSISGSGRCTRSTAYRSCLRVLFLVYQFVGVLGAGDAVGFLEETVFGKYLNPWITKIVHFFIPIPFVQELLIGDYGLFTMAITYAIAIVLPIVGFFFIAFSILEDSGYLPRLAVMVNRISRSWD